MFPSSSQSNIQFAREPKHRRQKREPPREQHINTSSPPGAKDPNIAKPQRPKSSEPALTSARRPYATRPPPDLPLFSNLWNKKTAAPVSLLLLQLVSLSLPRLRSNLLTSTCLSFHKSGIVLPIVPSFHSTNRSPSVLSNQRTWGEWACHSSRCST